MSTTLLLIDSQGRNLPSTPLRKVVWWSGARARDLDDMLDLLHPGDICNFDYIAIWVGGNDAHPKRLNVFNPNHFSDLFTGFCHRVKSLSPRSQIIVVSATMRQDPAPFTNIPRVNKVLKAIACQNNFLFANAYRAVHKAKMAGPKIKLEDGVHLTQAAVGFALNSIEYVIKHSSVRPLGRASGFFEERQIFVKGQNNVLSMMFGAQLMYNGVCYCTAEHAYQHTKCLKTRLFGAAEKVLGTPNPFEAKSAGKVANSLITVDERVKLLKQVIASRWHQQKDFRTALKLARGCTIVHNVNNKFWGRCSDGSGTNAYGRCLQQLLSSKI